MRTSQHTIAIFTVEKRIFCRDEVCVCRYPWGSLWFRQADSHRFRQRSLPSPVEKAQACQKAGEAPQLCLSRGQFSSCLRPRTLWKLSLRHFIWRQHLWPRPDEDFIQPASWILLLIRGSCIRATLLWRLRGLRSTLQIWLLIHHKILRHYWREWLIFSPQPRPYPRLAECVSLASKWRWSWVKQVVTLYRLLVRWAACVLKGSLRVLSLHFWVGMQWLSIYMLSDTKASFCREIVNL